MYFDVTVNGKDLTYRLKILEDNLTGLRVERLDVVKCKKIGSLKAALVIRVVPIANNSVLETCIVGVETGSSSLLQPINNNDDKMSTCNTQKYFS